jgi:hypothetical protein
MSENISTVDGYPLRATDPDCEVQELISRTLENCRAIAPLHPSMGQLYPEFMRVQDLSPRLSPALKRLDWNLRRENSEGGQWAFHFGPMINLILGHTDSASDEQLFFLCEYAEFLKQHHCHTIAEKIAELAWKLQKKSDLSIVLLDQLRKAQKVFREPGTRASALLQLDWTFFRAESNSNNGDPCWSAAVRRDLRAMPKKLRENWLALLDANDHAWNFPVDLPKPAAKLLARLDPHEFETRLDSWTQALAPPNPVEISDAGLTLLNYLLRICRSMPAAQVDQALYRMASARWEVPDRSKWWESMRATAWLANYLLVLPTRPASQAFACAEALTMNPATKDFAEVDQMYHGLLNASSKAVTPQTKPAVGIDRFRVEPGHPYWAEHAVIDQFLRASHSDERLRGPRLRMHNADSLRSLRESIVRQSALNLPNLVLALAERVIWLAAHAEEFTQDTKLFWRVETGKLMSDILGQMNQAAEDVLIAALQADGSNFFGVSPGGRILHLCQIHVDKNGWSGELLAAMKPWVKTQHGSHTALDIRRKAEWLMWFEDVSPIKADECWSGIVRSDLRSMPKGERGLWMPLVTNASFAIADKPPAKWLTPAKDAFEKLGAGKFRDRYRRWFQPFRDGQPVKLTSPGQCLLRMLIWYAMVAEDPSVDEALAWFAQAQWKTKAAADRSAKAETAFSYVMAQRNPAAARDAFERLVQSGRAYQGSKVEKAYLELCQRFGTPALAARIAAEQRLVVEDLKARAVRSMKEMVLQQLGEGSSWEEDILVLNHCGETYRIDSRSGRITRQSDGAVIRVEVPHNQMPYKIFRAQIDGHDLNHPGEPNMMRTMMCARVLRRGDKGQFQVDPT